MSVNQKSRILINKGATNSNSPTDGVELKRKRKLGVTYKRFGYSEEQLNNAITHINAGSSVNNASKVFEIPKTTLFNKIHNNVPLERRMGPLPTFDLHEEREIIHWIMHKANLGFPMPNDEVKNLIKYILDKKNIKTVFPDNIPGKGWMRLFFKRNPEIKDKNTEIATNARVPLTKESVLSWFNNVLEYLKEEDASDILNDPSRIYNIDETEIILNPEEPEEPPGEHDAIRRYYLQKPEKEKKSVILLCAYCANGQDIDPMIIDDIEGKNECASNRIYDFITQIFYPKLLKKKTKFPVIVFLDRFKLHINIPLHHFCIENNIILYCLPPNAVYMLQPTDSGIFQALEMEWKRSADKFTAETREAITEFNYVPIFAQAYKKSKENNVIQKAFKNGGLYPFNPDILDFSKYSSESKHIYQVQDTNNDESNISAEDEDYSITQFLSTLEAQIPDNIKKTFLECYGLKKFPEQEQVLYQIWFRYKNLVSGYEPSEISNRSDGETIDIHDIDFIKEEKPLVGYENELNLEDEQNNYEQPIIAFIGGKKLKLVDRTNISNTGGSSKAHLISIN